MGGGGESGRDGEREGREGGSLVARLGGRVKAGGGYL